MSAEMASTGELRRDHCTRQNNVVRLNLCRAIELAKSLSTSSAARCSAPALVLVTGCTKMQSAARRSDSVTAYTRPSSVTVVEMAQAISRNTRSAARTT